jgi:uncharacterized protein (DUF433 family)
MAPSVHRPTSQPNPNIANGALRSRTVAKLAGVTLRQLGYWHSTGLIKAHAMPGYRGNPRLYSWIDYIKIRAAKKLQTQGLSTRRIRSAIAYLDEKVADWYLLPLHAFHSRVLVELPDLMFVAEDGRQLVLPLVKDVLYQLMKEGPLGELREFSDHVDMDPGIMSGNPVIKGTRLETAFIAGLVQRSVTPAHIGELYLLTAEQVDRSLAFARAAA